MSFCNAKYVVLALLVVQNTFYVLLVRYTRTRPGTMYLSSTAVCCDEVSVHFGCYCHVLYTTLTPTQLKYPFHFPSLYRLLS